MSKAHTTTDSDAVSDSLTTDVFHDGNEVAVRSRSKFSRKAHDPVTDADGNIVFYAPTDRGEAGPIRIVDEDHDDAEPRPACSLPTGDPGDVDFMLSKVECVQNREKCSYCDGTNGDPAQGSDNKSFARIARYGDDWGEA